MALQEAWVSLVQFYKYLYFHLISAIIMIMHDTDLTYDSTNTPSNSNNASYSIVESDNLVDVQTTLGPGKHHWATPQELSYIHPILEKISNMDLEEVVLLDDSEFSFATLRNDLQSLKIAAEWNMKPVSLLGKYTSDGLDVIGNNLQLLYQCYERIIAFNYRAPNAREEHGDILKQINFHFKKLENFAGDAIIAIYEFEQSYANTSMSESAVSLDPKNACHQVLDSIFIILHDMIATVGIAKGIDDGISIYRIIPEYNDQDNPSFLTAFSQLGSNQLRSLIIDTTTIFSIFAPINSPEELKHQLGMEPRKSKQEFSLLFAAKKILEYRGKHIRYQLESICDKIGEITIWEEFMEIKDTRDTKAAHADSREPLRYRRNRENENTSIIHEFYLYYKLLVKAFEIMYELAELAGFKRTGDAYDEYDILNMIQAWSKFGFPLGEHFGPFIRAESYINSFENHYSNLSTNMKIDMGWNIKLDSIEVSRLKRNKIDIFKFKSFRELYDAVPDRISIRVWNWIESRFQSLKNG